MTEHHQGNGRGRLVALCGLTVLIFMGSVGIGWAQGSCARTIKADVVALDQVFFWNRLGVMQPQGMIFALAGDIVPMPSTAPGCDGTISPGCVQLRSDKRPRPITLRMNVGDCLEIGFTNLLNPVPVDNDQAATRSASVHVIGMQLVNSIEDDGSNVGLNASSLVPPGGSKTYTLYSDAEGGRVLFSAAAMTGGEGDGGQQNAGLFGSVNVEPAGAVWYRSQVTQDDLELASSPGAGGFPIIDYDAIYPVSHPRAGLPILKMLCPSDPAATACNANEIVHTDLTAIIAGSNSDGTWPTGTFPDNAVYPRRYEPFREFTINYHDEIGALQAFPELFDDPVLGHTLHSVRDGFAFNYGTGGIGAEIIANRLGVGPMWDCPECKYEEFFLTSWTVGDPAMVVDIPANADLDGDGALDVGPKATKAFYPDDPSNVYHSYLQDHVKFRILHGGSKEHHIHHQHTHQWVYSPDSDNSSYLDSQALGPGSSFTLEMVYNGSGNRNQAVGDSIFHCHFYPHFAQGMWAMWRVHDVLETGTVMDANGRPAPGARALPDPEIVRGTPIPAVVSLPGLPMAPLPDAKVEIVANMDTNGDGFDDAMDLDGDGIVDAPGGSIQVTALPGRPLGNPGYPFWIPGVIGHRPPHPLLDLVDSDGDGNPDDGGLPRHVILSDPATERLEVHTRLDFTVDLTKVKALQLAEGGEPIEQVAMAFHAQREHPACLPDGTCDYSIDPLGGDVKFLANGLPPQPGAPFADPCIDDDGNAVGSPRRYKAANIQIDAIFSKSGWHFPQQRIITLWEDVQPTFDGTRPPEPFFFRANTNDCIEFTHTNLVPNVYELDDFQVRTPTDILGQHIHLVKFDVLASDGSANGWNYEDGNFSPDEVRERVHAIRNMNGCDTLSPPAADGTFTCPVAVPHPIFGAGTSGEFVGAQTTVQRWFADDVLNMAGEDRTLRTVFTHDHYGPSTHQQAGLYAGLVVEPEGSSWRDPETGQFMGSRDDGGPTSWHADIITADPADSYREFMLEYADFALAYEEGSHASLPSAGGPVLPKPWSGVARLPGQGFDNPPSAVNAPGKIEADLPDLVLAAFQVGECPGGAPLPCPEAISAEDPATMSVNYRSEPLAHRIRDPLTNSQASGPAGDLAMAFRSDINRADPDFNVQPGFYPPLTSGVEPGDPYTPLMRVYQRDNVQVRMLVGATEEGHNFSMNGIKWLSESKWPNSGWRNSQMTGISEHFEFVAPLIPTKNVKKPFSDYLYAPGSSVDDLWNGTWGLMRAYRSERNDLLPLPNNPPGGPTIKNGKDFRGACPRSAPSRKYDLTAISAAQALPTGTVIYNNRAGMNGEGPLNDPTGLLLVNTKDLAKRTGMLKNGVPIEPMILRANAGDCLQVTLRNALPDQIPDLDGWRTLPSIIPNFNSNDITPSSNVGLHPQLVAYDVSRDDGNNIGFNDVQTAQPGGSVTYKWYMGDLSLDANRNMIATPIEFGATNLIPADRIEHTNKGLIAALIVEPQGSTWVDESGPSGPGPRTRASATVTKSDGSQFREFVVMFQSDLNLRYGDGSAIPNLAESEDPEDAGQKAVNYRTEPMWFRMGFAPDMPLSGEGGGPATRDLDFSNVLSDSQVGGDPATPVFWAAAGSDVRFRVLDAGGAQRNHVFTVHGHNWQEHPYINGSTEIGENITGTWYTGARMGHGPTNHFDALLRHGAGGAFQVTGDYLWRDYSSFLFDGGIWGLLRVY